MDRQPGFRLQQTTRSARTAQMLRLLRVTAGAADYVLSMDDVAAVQDASAFVNATWNEHPVVEIDYQGVPLPAAKLSRRIAPLTGSQFMGFRQRAYLVVFAGGGKHPWAMIVDSVVAATHVPRTQIQPLPPCCGDRRTSPFLGVHVAPPADEFDRDSGRLTLLLDPAKLHPDFPLATDPPEVHRTKPMPPRAGMHLPSARYQMLNFQISSSIDPQVPTLLGLSYAQVLEIVEPSDLLPTPFAPSYVLGVALWRDRVVPLVDLALRLGLPPAEGAARRWAIARATPSGELVAFPVLPNVQSLRLPAPHRLSEFHEEVEMALGVFDLQDRTVIVPDLAAVAHFR